MALIGFPGPIVRLEDINAGFSSKSKTFSAKEIKSMEELSQILNDRVDIAFKNLDAKIRDLQNKPQSAPINTEKIINDLKANIKIDISNMLQDSKIIDRLSESITANDNFKNELNNSIKAQFDTLSKSLKAQLDKLETEHAAISDAHKSLLTDHNKISTKINEINIDILRHNALIEKGVTEDNLQIKLNDYVRKKPKDTGYINPTELKDTENPYMTVEKTSGEVEKPSGEVKSEGFLARIGNALSSFPNAFGGIEESTTPTAAPKTASRSTSIEINKKNKYLKGGSKYSNRKYSRRNLSESSDELELNNTLSDTSVN